MTYALGTPALNVETYPTAVVEDLLAQKGYLDRQYVVGQYGAETQRALEEALGKPNGALAVGVGVQVFGAPPTQAIGLVPGWFSYIAGRPASRVRGELDPRTPAPGPARTPAPADIVPDSDNTLAIGLGIGAVAVTAGLLWWSRRTRA